MGSYLPLEFPEPTERRRSARELFTKAWAARIPAGIPETIDLANRFPLFARRLHKWLAVVVGIQAAVWTLGGLYMTAVHIDIIHGDHFIRSPAPHAVAAGRLADPVAVTRAVPGGETLKLVWIMDRPVYVVAARSGPIPFNARTGRPLPAPARSDILRLADHWYVGDEAIESAVLIDTLPGEVRGRKPPLWRVGYGGWNKPTLYFSPRTGELVTRRHELWRVFDFVWMLHIMDYDTRENVNNPLLRVFTWAAALMALSGAWLLLFSFPRRRKARA